MFRKPAIFVLTMVIAGAFVVDAGALPEGDVVLMADFDGNLGEYPEGVAVDKSGNVFVSMSFRGEIWKVTPQGDVSVLYSGLDGSGFGVVGLAVDAAGDVYAAVASLNPATQGVYRINRDGATADLLPGTESLFFADGLAFDKRGNLYITDANEGAIYRVPRHGTAELWLQHPLLEGTGAFYGFVAIGANGIQYWKDSLIVANTEKFSIVTVPVLPSGAPGEPQVLFDAFIPAINFGWMVPDGLALDVHGGIYAADPALSQIVYVAADGSWAAPMATAETLLDNPTSVAFGTGKGDRKNLFIANFDLITPDDEAANGFPVNFDGPSLLKMGTGQPGNPLP